LETWQSIDEAATPILHEQKDPSLALRMTSVSSLRAVLPLPINSKRYTFEAKRRGNLPVFPPVSSNGNADLQVSSLMVNEDGKPLGQGLCMIRRPGKNKNFVTPALAKDLYTLSLRFFPCGSA